MLMTILLLPALAWASSSAENTVAAPTNGTTGDGQAVAQKDTTPRFYIQEYRVEGGGNLLTRMETEEAVYPYLGPYRTAADVDQARAALEQAYRNKGTRR